MIQAEFTPELLAKAKQHALANAPPKPPFIEIDGRQYYVMTLPEFTSKDFELSAKEKYKQASSKIRYFNRYGKDKPELKGIVSYWDGFSIIKGSRLRFYLNPINLWFEFKRMLRKFRFSG